MRVVLMITCLLWAAPVFAQSDRAFRLSFVGAIAAHTADITTTAYCLGQRTCHEVNPALKWAEHRPLALGLTKGATAGAMQLIPYWLDKKGHRRWAFVINVAQTVGFTALAIRNARLSTNGDR